MRWLAATGVATLAVGAVALGAPGTEGPVESARPAATFTSGSFTQSNSRNGMPVLSTANLAPGGTTTGSVTVANLGTLGGRFSLSALDRADMPGPNGGLLSGRLHLAIDDVTAPASAVRVYSGTLAAMTPRSLGRFAAGESRTYRFTAMLADDGSPPSPTGGDNAFAGSSTSVGFRWNAVESSSPPPPTGSPAEPSTERSVSDRRPPRVRLTILSVQRIDSRGYLVVRARCDEVCRIGITGSARAGRGRRFATRPIRGRLLAPRRWARLRVGMPRAVRGSALRRALLRDATVTVRLRLTARDRAGNQTVARRAIRLRRR